MTPLEALGRLVERPGVASIVARRADLTADLVRAVVAVGDVVALVRLGLNAVTPLDVRWRLVRHLDAWVRIASVGPTGGAGPRGSVLPREFWSLLVEDPQLRMREQLASDPRLPDGVRRVLAADEAGPVRAAMVRSWEGMPEPVYRRFLADTPRPTKAPSLSSPCSCRTRGGRRG